MRDTMTWTTLVVPVLLTVGGCGGYQPAPAPPSQQTAAQPPAGNPVPTSAQQTRPRPAEQSGVTAGMAGIGAAAGLAPLETAVGGPQAVAPVGRAPSQPSPAAGVPSGATYQKADVGVGAKGRGYSPGLITTPVSVFFRTQERITFQIAIPHAMNLYKASNGSAPKTHEEFMEKIIKEQRIKLPDLPQGQRYIYDPAKEELMVEHPAQ